MNTVDITLIEANIKSQLKGRPVAPLFIAGPPGIGKSTIIGRVSKNLDMNANVVSAPTLTTELLSGLPSEYLTPELNHLSRLNLPVNSTSWSIPEILADTARLAEAKPTILVLDDFHMVPKHLQSYFFSLLLERRLGNFVLPSNVVIIGTMNDSEEAGFNGINSAVRNRMAIHKVAFDFDFWFEHVGCKLDYRVSSYLKTKPARTNTDESTGIEGYETARAWTSLSAEFAEHTDEFIQANSLALANTQISIETAIDFEKHVNYIAAINFEDLVKKKRTVNMSQLDPLNVIIHAYITNFIVKAEDGMYLLSLLSDNINEEAFVGFVFGNIYTIYTDPETVPDGLRLIIDRLFFEEPQDIETYTASAEKLTKLFDIPIVNKDLFREIAGRYIIDN